MSEEELRKIKEIDYTFWSNCIGHGNSMLTVEEVRDMWHLMIQTIEQQQKEIENLSFMYKITQAKLEKLKESICDPRKSNLTGGNHDL